jgi:hypothetical protein
MPHRADAPSERGPESRCQMRATGGCSKFTVACRLKRHVAHSLVLFLETQAFQAL